MTKVNDKSKLTKSEKITINRHPERSRFTIISNDIIQNRNLSLQAKGLLLTILSLPDDWKLYKTTIHRLSSSGKAAAATAWAELVKNGYIVSERIKEGNLVVGWSHTVFEKPVFEESAVFPVFGDTNSRISENRSLLNTNNTNTKNTIIPTSEIQQSEAVPEHYDLHMYINELRKEYNHELLKFTTSRSQLYARLFKMKYKSEELKLIARYRFHQLSGDDYRQYQVPETVFRFKNLQGWLDEAKAWEGSRPSRLYQIG